MTTTEEDRPASSSTALSTTEQIADSRRARCISFNVAAAILGMPVRPASGRGVVIGSGASSRTR